MTDIVSGHPDRPPTARPARCGRIAPEWARAGARAREAEYPSL